MKWQDLVEILARHVPHGKITTYAEVSEWGYGKRSFNQPVRSLLTGAANKGFTKLTNRVISSDGSLADLPEGQDQQRKQLIAEGLMKSDEFTVNLDQHRPVKLPSSQSGAA